LHWLVASRGIDSTIKIKKGSIPSMSTNGRRHGFKITLVSYQYEYSIRPRTYRWRNGWMYYVYILSSRRISFPSSRVGWDNSIILLCSTSFSSQEDVSFGWISHGRGKLRCPGLYYYFSFHYYSNIQCFRRHQIYLATFFQFVLFVMDWL
jgi:hypothetical protein